MAPAKVPTGSSVTGEITVSRRSVAGFAQAPSMNRECGWVTNGCAAADVLTEGPPVSEGTLFRAPAGCQTSETGPRPCVSPVLRFQQLGGKKERHPPATIVAAERPRGADSPSSVMPRVPVLSQTSNSRPSAPVRSKDRLPGPVDERLIRRRHRAIRCECRATSPSQSSRSPSTRDTRPAGRCTFAPHAVLVLEAGERCHVPLERRAADAA